MLNLQPQGLSPGPRMLNLQPQGSSLGPLTLTPESCGLNRGSWNMSPRRWKSNPIRPALSRKPAGLHPPEAVGRQRDRHQAPPRRNPHRPASRGFRCRAAREGSPRV